MTIEINKIKLPFEIGDKIHIVYWSPAYEEVKCVNCPGSSVEVKDGKRYIVQCDNCGGKGYSQKIRREYYFDTHTIESIKIDTSIENMNIRIVMDKYDYTSDEQMTYEYSLAEGKFSEYNTFPIVFLTKESCREYINQRLENYKKTGYYEDKQRG